jgi:hypothetical protein
MSYSFKNTCIACSLNYFTILYLHVYNTNPCIFPDNTFFPLLFALLLDHLGEPIDLDLNADHDTTGKTDDIEQTVQLRPKAPSKPPRTFVSTDLDNPNCRIDLGEYQKEIDVPESQGFQGGTVKKSESGLNAFNLPYDGNDERVLVESPSSKRKQSSKKSKKKSKPKHPPKEHVYAVIDKKSKRRKNHGSRNQKKENIYEEIGMTARAGEPPPELPSSPPPSLLRQLSIIGVPVPESSNPQTNEKVDEIVPKKQVKKLDPSMMLFQSSTEDEVIPELLKPLPEKVKRHETTEKPTEVPYDGIEKIENVSKDMPTKSNVDPTRSEKLSDNLSDSLQKSHPPKPETLSSNNFPSNSAERQSPPKKLTSSLDVSASKSKKVEVLPEKVTETDVITVLKQEAKEEVISSEPELKIESPELKGTENERSLDSGIGLDEVNVNQNKKVDHIDSMEQKTDEKSVDSPQPPNVEETSVIQPTSVISKNPLAIKSKPKIEPKRVKQDPSSFDTSESFNKLQPVKVEDKLKKSKPVIPEGGDTLKNPLVRKSYPKPEPKNKPDPPSLDVIETSKKIKVATIETAIPETIPVSQPENVAIKNSLAKTSKPKTVDKISIDENKSDISKEVQPKNIANASISKEEKPLVHLDIKISTGTSISNVDKTSPKTSLNPLARKSKKVAAPVEAADIAIIPSSEKLLPKDNLPIFRMAPASTAAKVPGTRSAATAAKTNTEDTRLSREPSLNQIEPDKNHPEDDDDLDLTLFSKYLPKAKKKTPTVKQDKLSKGLTRAEEQALDEAQKAKEAETLQAQKLEEQRLTMQKEARLQRRAEDQARLAKTRQLQIEKDLKAQAKKVSDNAPRPSTEDLRAQLKLMTNKSDFRQKRVDDLQIDDDDDLLPGSRNRNRNRKSESSTSSSTSSSSSSSSGSEAEIGLVTESAMINKGMCMLTN